MTHGSLFSGIGGFDLAAEWMGWKNIFHCEINPFGQKVLNHYWPNAISYEDITKTDFSIHRGTIDVLTGGFPCQPYSVAGLRKGKDDERHLWPEMLRAIREIKPRWIVGENVLGIVSWNDGMVFEEVQANLEAEGYEVQPYVLPASGVDAPHKRYRVFFIANSKASNDPGTSRQNERSSKEERLSKWDEIRKFSESNNIRWTVSNSKVTSGGGELQQRQRERQFGRQNITDNTRSKWRNFPAESPICGRNDGLPRELDGITLSKWKDASIEALGNAVIPQVVYNIFKAIELWKSSN